MKFCKSESAYITIETTGTFIPFMLLIISILSLVNVVTLQVRLHYALTQCAGTVSMYCYVFESAGISDEMTVIDDRGKSFAEATENILTGINALTGQGGDTGDIINMAESAGDIIADPIEMIRNFANYGISGVRSFISQQIARPLVLRYLTNSKISASEYFSKTGVTRFDITDCVLIDRNGNIRITAEYEVYCTFGTLRIPFTPKLRISQTVVTKAWGNGSGEGYKR